MQNHGLVVCATRRTRSAATPIGCRVNPQTTRRYDSRASFRAGDETGFRGRARPDPNHRPALRRCWRPAKPEDGYFSDAPEVMDLVCGAEGAAVATGGR